MSTAPFLRVSKPISVWKKPLEASWGGLFKSLTSSVGAGVTLQWDKLAESLVDMGTSLGLETTVEERIGALVLRALARAIAELVAERQGELPEHLSTDDRMRHLDDVLEAHELNIGPTFLDRPNSLELPGIVAPLVADWFETHGVIVASRSLLEVRLQRYFVYSLMAEWRSRPAEYEPILAALDTPFASAGEREYAWHQYRADLERHNNQPLFGEPFGLEQVYMPLRAYHKPKVRPGQRTPQQRLFQADPEENYEPRRPVVVDLQSHLLAWLEVGDRQDALRLVSGGPGSGKSSFARWFAAHLGSHRRVVIIPLFDLDLTDSLPRAVDEFLVRKGYPLMGLLGQQTLEEQVVVIFDGLDELSLRGSLGQAAARHFMRQVERVLRDMNHTRCRLHVLVTGRELAIQGAESERCAPEQTLHVLPYYLPEQSRKPYDDPGDLLADDQRDAWWVCFGEACGRPDLASLPDELKRPDLDEITAEPLLCYLVALGFRAGDIDLSQAHIDLGLIYDGLLRSVYRRNYEGRRHKSLTGIERFEDFAVILEEIGLAAWHGRARTTTIGTIRSYCRRNRRLGKLLDGFEADARTGVSNLLLAFYFRQSGTDVGGDATYEFTHLSFGEYLTARRIARTADRMSSKLIDGDRGDEDGWDERQALVVWARVCGPTAMEANVARFLDAEIEYRYRKRAEAWQDMGCRLLGHALRHAMPMDELQGITFQEKTRWAANAEVSLLILLSGCARATERVSAIAWPQVTSFGTWLRRVVVQRSGADNPLVTRRLSWLDLSHCRIDIIDLYGANLSRAHLQNAPMNMANLQGANLQGARMERAKLWVSNLEGADLERANLQGADLERANLQDANLQGANLQGANLGRAILEDANLEGAYLEGAYLQDANLRGANLEGANLEDANLEGAKLEDANLEGANLGRARLQAARFSSTTRWPSGFDPEARGCRNSS